MADEDAKAICGELRLRVASQTREHMVGTQYGDGNNAASCELARMFVQATETIAELQNMACARIHVDVVGAFASIISSMVLSPQRP